MLKPDDAEMQKLKNIAYDEGAIIALKKFFLCNILERGLPDRLDIIAASRIALDYVRDAIEKLERMKENEEEHADRKNIV